MADGAASEPIANIGDLPISSHVGPEVQELWRHTRRTVEEHISDTTGSLRKAHDVAKHRDESLGSPSPLATPRARRPWVPRESAFANKAHHLLRLETDPRYLEMQAVIEAPTKDAGYLDVPLVDEESNQGEWRRRFQTSVGSVLTNLHTLQEPKAAERYLQSSYEWYRQHRTAVPLPTCAIDQRQMRPSSSPALPLDLFTVPGPYFHDFCAGEGCMPGSAFYRPSEGHAERDEADGGLSPAASPNDGQFLAHGLQPPVAQLLPARERLRDFETKHIINPLTARRLKAAELDSCCPSPEPYDRPFTPSTATGGCTARSIASARSTPTPTQGLGSAYTGSRPTSALSYRRPPSRTAESRLAAPGGARPESAGRFGVPSLPLPLPQQRTPCEAVWAAVEEAERRRSAQEAENTMEERWVTWRHREIADQIAGEEHRGAVRAWSERRARVEEEISRNAEAARFQSQFQHRGFVPPTDARTDIAATGSVAASPSSGGLQARSVAPHHAPPRFDVSSAVREEAQVRFLETNHAVSSRARQPPLSARIAHLRRLHAGLLKTPEEAGGDADKSGAPSSIFDTEVGQQYASLSAYTFNGPQDTCEAQRLRMPRLQDGSDVLAAVCNWWREKHNVDAPTPADVGTTLEEMRFRQLQEVEEVKRVFARRNCPVNAVTLERALVMPRHVMKPGTADALFNATPNLMANPFAKGRKGKAKGKKKGGGAKGGKSKSPAPNAVPASKASAAPGKPKPVAPAAKSPARRAASSKR